VEIRETVREIQIPLHIPAEAATNPEPKRPLSNLTEADLLSYGVPSEWIPDVRTADDDMLLVIASHLPGEAAEAIIDLATGTTPTKPEVRPPDQSNPYEHPDAQRRFRVLTGTEELARALDYPWERWIVFLHPSQSDWVSRSFHAPTRVQGSAGTGKTVVALHRAVHPARRNPEARVLLTTFSEPLAALLQDKLHRLIQRGAQPDGEAFVVDECQDITAGQLRFLAARAGTSTDALFFAGDLGQRIFQQPFSWTQYGVDIRGRSRTLRINYRTSHQIRSQADQLLDPKSRDVDGNVQDRRGAISIFNGPEPDIRECDDTDSETEQVADWIEQHRSEGLTPREFGIFVRSEAEITRAESALQLAELSYERLQPSAMRLGSKATLSTMHLAKGLEFRTVIVMACDEDVIPNAERIKAITDDSDLDEVVATERHLLYVACTRARDHLLITSGDTCSEFVEDLLG